MISAVSQVELRRERYMSEYLDPRRGFERVRVPLEVRWDPLTGQSCRLLPEGSIPPPARHDLELLAEETRPTCPFCPEAVEEQTPRFPPEVWPEGRIRRGEAVLFPNLVPYAKWSSVSIYSAARHLLPIGEITPALLADNLSTQVAFAEAVIASDPGSARVTINANQLAPSGSSVFHPHLQGAASPVPTPVQRLLAELPARTLQDYAEAERHAGERYIGSTDGIVWLASFAPCAPGEIRGVLLDPVSSARLGPALVEELARGISVALRVFADLGFQSYNLALYGAPPGTRGHVLVRVVARAYFGAAGRSDAMWSERLHSECATDLAPERVAALARAALG